MNLAALLRHLMVVDQERRKILLINIAATDERSSYASCTERVPILSSSPTGVHHIAHLLSVLKGQKEVFFFDVDDPRKARFLSSADPPLSGNAVRIESVIRRRGGMLIHQLSVV